MFRNNLILAFRHFKKQRITSLVCITSLSIGLVFCILIYLYIKDELTYDRFHKNADNIYNVIENDHYYNFSSNRTSIPLADELSKKCLDIINFSRISRTNGVVKIEDRMFNERVHVVDNQFFEIFSFSLKQGNPNTALQLKNSVILTESYALKFFGKEDPIGKTITVILGMHKTPFIVSAISNDPPKNSTIQYNILINIDNLNTTEEPNALLNWNRGSVVTYLLLKNESNLNSIEKEILNICKSNRTNFYSLRNQNSSLLKDEETFTYKLQNLKESYLGSSNIHGVTSSDFYKSYILAGIAFFMLIIGIINFLNISLAQASTRFLEIGLRKVFGANSKQFIQQFWSESIVMVLFSFIVGYIISFLVLPLFNELAGKSLSFSSLFSPINIAVFVFMIIILGLASSIYPAVVISNFKIIDIFKSNIKLSSKSILRKSLVLFQFIISIFFIISSLVITKQLDFIKNYDTGFKKQGLVIIRLQGSNAGENQSILNLYKNRIRNINSVQSIAGCETSPNRTVLMGSLDIEGKRVDVHFNRVDFNYINTMQMHINDGRDFSSDYSTDTFSVIVNQKLAKEIEYPIIGKTLRLDGDDIFKIIGVVDDYNFLSLEEEIKPIVLSIGANPRYNFALVRIDPNNITNTINELDKLWKEIQPDKVFKYSFLDEDMNNFYKKEEKINSIVKYTSIFIIIITCMGIFGLTLFTSQQRVKEVSIRKIVGASNQSIIALLLKDTILLNITAIIIAWPISYYLMTIWLERYAYRVSLELMIFILAGIFIIIISVATISYIAFKVAYTNPVESLRNE